MSLIHFDYPLENIKVYETLNIPLGIACHESLMFLGLDPDHDSLWINYNKLKNTDTVDIPHDAHVRLCIKSQTAPGMEPKINSLRKDYSNLPVYTIDPSGSTDADDGFSITEDPSGNIHLLIHIADPTAFLKEDGNLFKHIIHTGQTRYPFGEPPVHLFPKEILNQATLISRSDIKTVSVHAVFEPRFSVNSRWKLVSAGIEYCTVVCDTPYRFTYEQAAKLMFEDKTLLIGAELAVQLWRDRTINTPWIDNTILFNDMSLTVPKQGANGPILEPDTDRVKIMKAMIAEFAILSNTVFAQGLNEDSIFLRSASVTEGIRESTGLTGEALLKKIIMDGVSATYTNKKDTHDIVSGSFYTHSTSPLRRASDCIVHFLLKAKAIGIPAPFTEAELSSLAKHLTCKSKEFKQEQFASIKKQTLIWISNNLPINAECTIMSVINGFINISINRLNGMSVNISYSLRQPCNKQPGSKFSVVIKECNLTGSKYDAGTLPDLEREVVIKNI